LVARRQRGTLEGMIVMIVAMLVCVAAAAVVVGYVAVEARRDGREVLTPRGERILRQVRRQGEDLRDRGEDAARRTARTLARAGR
jgi:hypothetical protein